MLKALLAVGFLVTLPVIGLAQANDPHVGVQEDGLRPADVSTQLDTVQPTAPACEDNDGNCSFIFINDLSVTITDFEFDTSAFSFDDPNVPNDGPGAYSYTCSSGYFLDCSATLNSLGDGMYDLDYSFWGVDPTDGNGYSTENPSGLPEGIAPGDTFYISLDGWTGDFQNLTLTNSYSVPEASSVLILLTELFLFAGFLAIFRRKLNWKLRLSLKA